MIPDYFSGSATTKQDDSNPIDIFKAFNDMVDLMNIQPPRKTLIMPTWFFKVRPKPRWYRFWTKRRRLQCLKTKRRYSLMLEGVMPNFPAFGNVEILKVDTIGEDKAGRAYLATNLTPPAIGVTLQS